MADLICAACGYGWGWHNDSKITLPCPGFVRPEICDLGPATVRCSKCGGYPDEHQEVH